MNEHHLAVEMTFVSTPHGSDEQFEQFLDEVLTQLEAIGRDVDLAAKLRDRVADFAATINALDFNMAAASFLVDLRTALHAAGCHTPQWPKFEATEHTVRELQDA